MVSGSTLGFLHVFSTEIDNLVHYQRKSTSWSLLQLFNAKSDMNRNNFRYEKNDFIASKEKFLKTSKLH